MRNKNINIINKIKNNNNNINKIINNKNNNKMTKKLKFTELNILKMNNKTYLPYQLPQLPKWFDKYNTEFLNTKGYCYISLDDHYNNNNYFNYNNFKDRLVFHKSYSHSQSR